MESVSVSELDHLGLDTAGGVLCKCIVSLNQKLHLNFCSAILTVHVCSNEFRLSFARQPTVDVTKCLEVICYGRLTFVYNKTFHVEYTKLDTVRVCYWH